MLITSAPSASSVTDNGSGNGEAPAGEDCFVQLLAFDSHRVARRLRETLAGGAMYVHVIADGSVFYEIPARPVVFPGTDEDRVGTWTPEEPLPCPGGVGVAREPPRRRQGGPPA